MTNFVTRAICKKFPWQHQYDSVARKTKETSFCKFRGFFILVDLINKYNNEFNVEAVSKCGLT